MQEATGCSRCIARNAGVQLVSELEKMCQSGSVGVEDGTYFGSPNASVAASERERGVRSVLVADMQDESR